MNTKIEKLISKLNEVKAEAQAKRSELESKVQAELDKVWNADKALQSDLTRLESSGEYGSDDGGIYQWIRSSVEFPAEEFRSYFEAYLSDHCVHVDFEHEAFKAYVGGAIVINEEGDVYSADDGINADSWIVERHQYTDEEGEADESKRNALIEAWMDKRGYFPGVFSMDRYGNVFPVDTRSEETKLAAEALNKAAAKGSK